MVCHQERQCTTGSSWVCCFETCSLPAYPTSPKCTQARVIGWQLQHWHDSMTLCDISAAGPSPQFRAAVHAFSDLACGLVKSKAWPHGSGLACHNASQQELQWSCAHHT